MLLGEMDFAVQPTGRLIEESSLFVYFREGQVLLAGEGEALRLPCWQEIHPCCSEEFQPFELARTAGRGMYSPAPFAPFALAEPQGMGWHSVQVFRQLPYRLSNLLTSCWHLWSWYQTHRFCGFCGGTMEPDGQERALRCPVCGKMVFPTIAPAVITAITCGDKILLAKGRARDHYGLVAGYVEVGESLEHAVRRETREEVGLELTHLRYVGDQPWGITGSHMFGFQAEASDAQPIVLQQSELEDARWVSRDALPPCDHPVSVAAELIERFRQGSL